MGESASMASTISTALGSFVTDLVSVASTAVPIGASCLLVWIGFRLAAKLSNRGAGK